jgi:leucyl-tRNA synthetase
LLKDETVNLVIQINGKKRDILSVKKDINENELLKMVNSNEKIKNFILNKKIMKKIFVPNKIINLIVK